MFRSSLIFVLLSACVFSPLTSFASDEETQTMVDRLAAIERSQNPANNGYLNDQRATYMRQSLSNDIPMGEQIMERYKLAEEYVRANQNENAINVIEEIHTKIAHIPKESIRAILRDFNNLLALAWIRFGEQENCLQNHSSDSCLFPISGNGIHQLTRGSTEATKVLRKHLEFDPDDLEAQWLINLAAMTLGDYPEAVPPQFRISPRALESDYTLPRFSDIAPAAGIAINGLAGGGAMTDFNN
ncbi:MAG: hypothetical protein HOL92_00235, partial [Opitutales bacterium]|nr:hypothetical protein [Opitutales bacterium]